MHDGERTPVPARVLCAANPRGQTLAFTPKGADFEDLAKVASQICVAPIVVVNLFDMTRKFFKAKVGLVDAVHSTGE